MTDRKIFRGDDYPEYRPVYRYELVTPEIDPETELPIPYNMANCTIHATFKQITSDILLDPTDESAMILADIEFGPDGSVASATNFSLPSGKSAADGILHLTLTRTLTADILPEIELISDIQVTDALDHDETITVVGKLVAIDGVTNRR